MLSFLKKLFGTKSADVPAPYKVEAPKVEEFPFPPKKETVKKATTAKSRVGVKPAVKAKTVRKPQTPKPN